MTSMEQSGWDGYYREDDFDQLMAEREALRAAHERAKQSTQEQDQQKVEMPTVDPYGTDAYEKRIAEGQPWNQPSRSRKLGRLAAQRERRQAPHRSIN